MTAINMLGDKGCIRIYALCIASFALHILQKMHFFSILFGYFYKSVYICTELYEKNLK